MMNAIDSILILYNRSSLNNRRVSKYLRAINVYEQRDFIIHWLILMGHCMNFEPTATTPLPFQRIEFKEQNFPSKRKNCECLGHLSHFQRSNVVAGTHLREVNFYSKTLVSNFIFGKFRCFFFLVLQKFPLSSTLPITQLQTAIGWNFPCILKSTSYARHIP